MNYKYYKKPWKKVLRDVAIGLAVLIVIGVVYYLFITYEVPKSLKAKAGATPTVTSSAKQTTMVPEYNAMPADVGMARAA